MRPSPVSFAAALTRVRPARIRNWDSLKDTKQIEIQGLPATSLPADVQRAALRRGVQGITDVTLKYNHFEPTGAAVITLAHQDYLQSNLRLLLEMTHCGRMTACRPLSQQIIRSRMRGQKGRADAAARGVANGEEPQGGINRPSKFVSVSGFPGKFTPDIVAAVLREFKIARHQGRAKIFQAVLPRNEFSIYSRFIVELQSEAEAHRLVRQIHLRRLPREELQANHILRARVVY